MFANVGVENINLGGRIPVQDSFLVGPKNVKAHEGGDVTLEENHGRSLLILCIYFILFEACLCRNHFYIVAGPLLRRTV